ncbi:MAG: YceI family protein [Deltaproteobacteria bacterium]
MNWKRFSIPATLALLLALAPRPAVAECTYSVAPNGVAAEWTAFKTTSKAPVKGHFSETMLEGPHQARTLTALAKGLRMKITGKSVKTGNPGRDVTIASFFFAFMKDGGAIEGQATKVEGDDKKGILHIDVTMNGQTRDVPFAYTISDKLVVAATASIDILDFRMKPAYEQLHRACEEKHTGDDGVAKTWTTVDLALAGTILADCD